MSQKNWQSSSEPYVNPNYVLITMKIDGNNGVIVPYLENLEQRIQWSDYFWG